MPILRPLPERLLLGPGPSNAHPSVLEAMSRPLVGHLDPDFITLLDRVKEGLRTVFGTTNAMTLPISATGSAGMEAAIVNLLEPGESIVVGVNGVFGTRMAEVARRAGAEVTTVEAAWGTPLDDQAIYPRPHQDQLPIWVGVGGTPASIVRAAKLGLPVALAIIGGDPVRFRAFASLYRRTLAESGFDPEAIPLAVHGLGHIADSNEEAADQVYASFTANMNRIGRERGWPPLTRDQFDWMRSPEGSLVLGDPETVAAKILRWKEALGIDRFMLHTAGTVPHEAALHSIEMLGTKVSEIVRGT